MLVNDAFVKRFVSSADVVGTTLAVAARTASDTDVALGSKTIVGVVGDTVYPILREPARPTIYLPLSQWQFPLLQYTVHIGVRSPSATPAQLTRSVSAALSGCRTTIPGRSGFEPLAQRI